MMRYTVTNALYGVEPDLPTSASREARAARFRAQARSIRSRIDRIGSGQAVGDGGVVAVLVAAAQVCDEKALDVERRAVRVTIDPSIGYDPYAG